MAGSALLPQIPRPIAGEWHVDMGTRTSSAERVRYIQRHYGQVAQVPFRGIRKQNLEQSSWIPYAPCEKPTQRSFHAQELPKDVCVARASAQRTDRWCF